MALGETKGGESAEREGDQESREVRESEQAERWSGGQSRGEKKERERGDTERVSERDGERERDGVQWVQVVGRKRRRRTWCRGRRPAARGGGRRCCCVRPATAACGCARCFCGVRLGAMCEGDEWREEDGGRWWCGRWRMMGRRGEMGCSVQEGWRWRG